MSNSVNADEPSHLDLCYLQKPITIAVAVKVKESHCCSILPVTLKMH